MNQLVPGQFTVGAEPEGTTSPTPKPADVVILVRPGTTVHVDRSSGDSNEVLVLAAATHEVLVGEVTPADARRRRLRRV